VNLGQRFISYIHGQHIFTKNNRLLLAVSGGVDSVALAHLCKQAGFDAGIAHCNFQLRGADSERDEIFVKEFAAGLEMPFHAVRFDTRQYADTHRVSTQVAARELRYGWFEIIRQQQEYDFILTAHHADDNIETVLMNFFRGTGINGLTGMKPVYEKIRRPLLFARRTELETYLTDHKLSFVQDESNLHDDYTRNYFRNTILPLISKTYPEVQQNLADNIERFKEVETLYSGELARIKKKLFSADGENIRIPVLKLKKTPAMKTILLELIRPYGFKPTQLNEVVRLLDSDSGRYMVSESHRILKDRKHLVISALKDSGHTAVVIEGEGQVVFANGKLRLQKTEKTEIIKNDHIALIDAAAVQFPLLLRPWRAGDYFYPLGMPGKKKLAKFFIDRKLSLADKEKVWVVEMNRKIIWVIGHRPDDRFKVTGKTREVLRIEWNEQK